MTDELKKNKAFYQNLGKLFYAIAFIDENISKKEIEALKETTSYYWPNANNQCFILDTFSWLQYNQDYLAKDCYNSFIEFKNKNKYLFTHTVKQNILNTAIAIASSFAKTNKAELIFLAKLEIELKTKI